MRKIFHWIWQFSQVLCGPNTVTSGGFDSDTAWTKGTNWTISGGYLVGTNVPDGATASQYALITVGNTYRVQYTIVEITGGSVRIKLGNGSGTDRNSIGTYVEEITCVSYTSLFIRGSGFTGKIDNVSACLLP